MSGIRSMTGFGRGEAKLGDALVVAELRSVNHRHLELRLQLDRELELPPSFFEDRVRATLRRGRVTGSVELRRPTTSPKEELRERLAPLIALRDELDPSGPFPWAALPLVGQLVQKTPRDPAADERAAAEALEAALAQLAEMRRFEGERLAEELRALLERLKTELEGVKARSPEAVEAAQLKLKERVAELLEKTGAESLRRDGRIDADRLELELAILADRADIREEIARLEAHFEQFAALMERDDPVGRRLDFLIQEMGREINTIGSKSADVLIARAVVEMKATLEQLREQIQNIA